jgi:hypothetical protein
MENMFDGGRSDISWIDGRCEMGGRWNWWDEARCRWLDLDSGLDGFRGSTKGRTKMTVVAQLRRWT